MKMSNEVALVIMSVLFIVLTAGTIISLIALAYDHTQSFVILVVYIAIYNVLRALYRATDAISDAIKRGEK